LIPVLSVNVFPATYIVPSVVEFSLGVNVAVYFFVPACVKELNVPPVTVISLAVNDDASLYIVNEIVAVFPYVRLDLLLVIVQYWVLFSVNVRFCFE
jgi:hypothetical protein